MKYLIIIAAGLILSLIPVCAAAEDNTKLQTSRICGQSH